MYAARSLLVSYLILLAACGAESDASAEAEGGEIAATTEDCTGCPLRLDEIVALGTVEGPGIIESEAAIVSRDARGRFYVHQEYGSRIKVFAPDGEFLTTIGRPGSGPGEFAGIAAVRHIPGDAVHVFDTMAGRRSEFSAAYDFVQSIQMEIRPSSQLLLLDDGKAVLASPMPPPELARYPLHLLGDSGSRIRSFGARVEDGEDPDPFPTLPAITRAGGDAVWMADRNRYRIELWDASSGDRPERVLERNVDWFPPEAGEEISLDRPPAPRLQAIRLDTQGRLLVILRVADEMWREAVKPGTLHPTVTDRHGFQDTIIELLDASTGALLGSVRSAYAITGFVDDNLVTAVVLDDDAVPYVRVWRVGPGE